MISDSKDNVIAEIRVLRDRLQNDLDLLGRILPSRSHDIVTTVKNHIESEAAILKRQAETMKDLCTTNMELSFFDAQISELDNIMLNMRGLLRVMLEFQGNPQDEPFSHFVQIHRLHMPNLIGLVERLLRVRGSMYGIISDSCDELGD